MPTIENKIYTGSEQTGVTGGTNINIIGDKSATNLGNYTVTIVPNGKACWNDGTRARIERTWKIDANRPSIMLNEKTAEWTGSFPPAHWSFPPLERLLRAASLFQLQGLALTVIIKLQAQA